MVCMDGFVLTHAFEELEVPDAETVDAFLPRVAPAHVLDPDDPMTIGAMVGPEAFTEVRWLMHRKQLDALARDPPDRRALRGGVRPRQRRSRPRPPPRRAPRP